MFYLRDVYRFINSFMIYLPFFDAKERNSVISLTFNFFLNN